MKPPVVPPMPIPRDEYEDNMLAVERLAYRIEGKALSLALHKDIDSLKASKVAPRRLREWEKRRWRAHEQEVHEGAQKRAKEIRAAWIDQHGRDDLGCLYISVAKSGKRWRWAVAHMLLHSFDTDPCILGEAPSATAPSYSEATRTKALMPVSIATRSAGPKSSKWPSNRQNCRKTRRRSE